MAWSQWKSGRNMGNSITARTRKIRRRTSGLPNDPVSSPHSDSLGPGQILSKMSRGQRPEERCDRAPSYPSRKASSKVGRVVHNKKMTSRFGGGVGSKQSHCVGLSMSPLLALKWQQADGSKSVDSVAGKKANPFGVYVWSI